MPNPRTNPHKSIRGKVPTGHRGPDPKQPPMKTAAWPGLPGKADRPRGKKLGKDMPPGLATKGTT